MLSSQTKTRPMKQIPAALTPASSTETNHALPIALGHHAPVLAAAAGVGAWTVPLSLQWAALPPLLALTALGCAVVGGQAGRWSKVLAVLLLSLALGGAISSSLAAALLGVAVLTVFHPPSGPSITLAVIALQTSYVPTIEALISDGFASFGLEAAGPSLVAVMALLFVGRRRRLALLLAATAVLAITAISRTLGFIPSTEAGLAALPTIAIAAAMARGGSRGSVLGGVLLCALLALSWNITPPRLAWPNEVTLLLPTAPDAPEARHFASLAEGLRFAGLRVVENGKLEDIQEGAFVILPWLSASLAEKEADFAARFNALANARRWTVIMFGEHDGMGGLDTRAASLASRPLFRRDLSVPPGNGDTSGPLRAADGLAWLQRSVLNRGATTDPYDARARVLLAGDGWWADRDIGEWLWTGDYRWRQGDRGGRLTLAHAVGDLGGATWVAVGDTSPILTRQILGDPRPVLRLLELATLMPAVLLDVGLFLVALAVILRNSAHARSRLPYFGAITTLAATVLTVGATPSLRLPVPVAWHAIDLGESSFDASNFNATLAAEPKLLTAGWEIRRAVQPVSGDVAPPTSPTVSFLLVEGDARLGGATLSGCWRLGALDINTDGPRLMDAQACQVDGEAEILVGDRTGAAALRIPGPSGPWLVVLDRGFLAEGAPTTNTSWLLRIMRGEHED